MAKNALFLENDADNGRGAACVWTRDGRCICVPPSRCFCKSKTALKFKSLKNLINSGRNFLLGKQNALVQGFSALLFVSLGFHRAYSGTIINLKDEKIQKIRHRAQGPADKQ